MKKSFLIIATLYFLTTAGSSNAARQRISLAPQPGVFSQEDIEQEIIFGREMAAAILAEKKLIADAELSRYLNLVGQSVLRHANRPEIEFHFALIESPEINAYAAPGGYIFVTSAAFKLMQNEAELAGVLAHEIAHITDRHIVNVLKIRADDDSMTARIGVIIGSGAESANVIFEQAVGYAIDLLFSKGLAVEDEYSADKQGLFLAALAGYDPAAIYNFLERIKPVIESKNGEMTNTHPPFSQRLTRIKTIINDEGLSTLGTIINKSRFVRYRVTGG